MNVTVEDLLRLPALRHAKVLGGAGGLHKVVSSISVLESIDPKVLISEVFPKDTSYGSEIVITGFLNGYLVRDHASAKVRESYIRISAGLQSHTLTKDDYVWLENALLFLRPYWWSDREDGKMLMDAFLHTQTLAKKE